MGFAVFDQRDCSVKPAYELSPIELPGAGPKNKFICCMERQKWFDSFLTNEIVALNRLMSRRKNRILRPTTEIVSTLGLGPV
jgi:hypothetical protein